MSEAPRTALIFSGGLDSTTLLYYLMHHGHDLVPIGIDYGQRHSIELSHAMTICKLLDLPYKILDLRSLGRLLTGSSQTDPTIPVPTGHYHDESMKVTVVPNRNMVMLAAAGAIAVSQGCQMIAYGAHAGDHVIYPDCRPDFVQVMKHAFALCDWNPLTLIAPFQDWSKGEIVAEGSRLGVPYELTWTCYQHGPQPCRQCGSCIERAEAFREASIPDPGLEFDHFMLDKVMRQ